MAAELTTPIDEEFSGLPLPIIPDLDAIGVDGYPSLVNIHHGFHPESLFKQTVAGTALRNSWVQIVPVELHNDGSRTNYHRFYEGMAVPTDETDTFSRLILSAAGFVPDIGIDLLTGEPVVRRLTQAEAQYLRDPHPEDPFGYRNIGYRYEPMRRFFHDYLVGHGLADLENEVDAFLNAKTEQKRRYFGHFLLAKAAEVIVDPIKEKYSIVRRAGLLHPMMPVGPHTLVKYKLGTPEAREQLFERIAEKLNQAA